MQPMGNDVQMAVDGAVGVVQIDSPETLNALQPAVAEELAAALATLDRQGEVRCLLLLGTERAFATGASPADLLRVSVVEMQQRNPWAWLDAVAEVRKPVVAGVSGYALGSGFELALASDVIVAAETARFALNELTMGIIPGAGATQRLTRRLGPALTLDLLLTGRTLTADEARRHGLISRVVPRENWRSEALAVAHAICERAPLAVAAAKQAVRQAQETALRDGLLIERQLLNLLFATDDQKEGMRAHLENRPPVFAGR